MELQGSNTPRVEWIGDCLVIGFFEGDATLSDDLVALNDRLAGALQELIDEAEFKGKAESSAVTRVGAGSPVRKIGIVGLGKADDLTPERVRRATATAIRLAKREKISVLGISFPLGSQTPEASAQAMAEAVELTLHQDNRFKSGDDDKKPAKLERIDLLGLADQAAALTRARQIALGVILARELVSAPANVVTPITMAETAEAIAQEYGLSLQILEQADCEKLGMGAFLGVAKASDLPPKFIHLTYHPAGIPRKKLAIVGKGLTFDSGGLNLKVGASSIEMMKTDMGGAAATLGAAKAIAQLKPDVEVHFISAVTENMISGHAMRPGDILTASNGKTIEINNTDAEGRLTLADALVYAEKLEVDAIVDLATLTGACIVALGDSIGGLFSPNEDLAQAFLSVAKTSGEKFWQLPMEEKYFDSMKSVVADMKNTGARAGGAISASLFLKQFVKQTPWVHLDIAGPVWSDKDKGYNNAGGTGFGVRTLVDWVLS